MIVVGKSPIAQLVLHLSQPFIFATNTFVELSDALYTPGSLVPEHRLSVCHGRSGFVFTGFLHEFHRDTCQKTTGRRIQLPEISCQKQVHPAKCSVDAVCLIFQCADAANDAAQFHVYLR